MVINGRPTLACRTLTKNLPAEITLAPLPFFELIGDLSVDTGKWMRGMSERLEGWLHMKDPDPDLRRMEAKMDPDLAMNLQLDRCIECSCCRRGCADTRTSSGGGPTRRRFAPRWSTREHATSATSTSTARTCPRSGTGAGRGESRPAGSAMDGSGLTRSGRSGG
jgi:succinate dehydrogenase/fumarate reductase-like Fe-S protein